MHPEYNECICAHWWGMIPSEFYSLEPSEQARMLAVYTVHREIENYVHGEVERQSKQNSDAGGSGNKKIIRRPGGR